MDRKSLSDYMDPEKIKNIEKFVRGGGTQKTHKGQQSHGHFGSRCFHYSGQKYYDYWFYGHDEPKRLERRRIYRRGGKIEED